MICCGTGSEGFVIWDVVGLVLRALYGMLWDWFLGLLNVGCCGTGSEGFVIWDVVGPVLRAS